MKLVSKYTVKKHEIIWVGRVVLKTRNHQKRPFRAVLRKSCPENIQQIYRRIPMPKCDFNKLFCNFIEITLWYGCSPVNLLYIFRIRFSKSTFGGLLLNFYKTCTFSNIVLHIDLPIDTYFSGIPLTAFTSDAVLWSAG